MLSLIAQATFENDNVFEIITGIFSRGDALAHPTDLMVALRSMSIVWGAIFLTAGLVCMLNGYKFYKTIIIVVAASVGAFVGYALGKQIEAAYVVAGCLSLLLAVGCWPLMKYAVALVGGLAGAFLGANVWSASASLIKNSSQAEAMSQNYWIGALIGLLVIGMLSFILFKVAVVLFTSFGGSTIAVMGAIALLLQVPAWQDSISSSLTAHPIVVPMLIAVPTVIGLIMQQSQPLPQPTTAKSPAKTA